MKKTMLILIFALMMTALAACKDDPAATSVTPAASEGAAPVNAAASNVADQLYIEVSALGNLDYFYDHKMGLEMVGKELGVRTEYVGPAEYDMNAMIAAFETAISKKPNGIVVVG